MSVNTSAICDIYGDQIDVVEPIFSNFEWKYSIFGQITTIKCFEDCGVIQRCTLEQ